MKATLTVAAWLKDGIPDTTGARLSVTDELSILDVRHRLQTIEMGTQDAQDIVQILKDRGLLEKPASPSADPGKESLAAFLERSWTFDESPYVKERQAFSRDMSLDHNTFFRHSASLPALQSKGYVDNLNRRPTGRGGRDTIATPSTFKGLLEECYASPADFPDTWKIRQGRCDLVNLRKNDADLVLPPDYGLLSLIAELKNQGTFGTGTCPGPAGLGKLSSCRICIGAINGL